MGPFGRRGHGRALRAGHVGGARGHTTRATLGALPGHDPAALVSAVSAQGARFMLDGIQVSTGLADATGGPGLQQQPGIQP